MKRRHLVRDRVRGRVRVGVKVWDGMKRRHLVRAILHYGYTPLRLYLLWLYLLWHQRKETQHAAKLKFWKKHLVSTAMVSCK